MYFFNIIEWQRNRWLVKKESTNAHIHHDIHGMFVFVELGFYPCIHASVSLLTNLYNKPVHNSDKNWHFCVNVVVSYHHNKRRINNVLLQAYSYYKIFLFKVLYRHILPYYSVQIFNALYNIYKIEYVQFWVLHFCNI